MKAVVFVPGIMGTELHNTSEKLWPPTASETQFGYNRVDKLLADDVRPGAIIENVMCFDFYGSLLAQFDELGYKVNGTANRLFRFPYDWRVDLEVTAKLLAEKLDVVDHEGAQEIYIVAHSMGGLISRLVLETGVYSNRPWFKKIKSFIALATPHRGAPLALARILGLDSTLGISKSDFKRLATDPKYPSAYQLLPAPNEDACWSMDTLDVNSLDIYDLKVASGLGLNPELLKRAKYVHDSFAKGKAPDHVRYFYFAGTGHETVTRINVWKRNGQYLPDDMVVTRTEDAGDGTVPFWSAIPRAVQKEVVVNEHAQVFRGMPFKLVFYRLLGGDIGLPLQGLEQNIQTDPLRLSLATPIVQIGEEFELLIVPSTPVGSFEGSFFLRRISEGGVPVSENEEVSKLSYLGPRVSKLRLMMPPLAIPGLYQLTYEGTPSSSEILPFAVVSFG